MMIVQAVLALAMSLPKAEPRSPRRPLLCEPPGNLLALCLDKNLPNEWFALLVEGEAKVRHELAAVWVGKAVVDDTDAESVCELARVDQLVELSEGVLVGDLHPVVAPAANVVLKAVKVTNAWQDEGVEPFQEVVHERPEQHDFDASGIADTETFGVVVLLGLHDLGVCTRDAPDLLDDLVQDLCVGSLLRLQVNNDLHPLETWQVPRLLPVRHVLALHRLVELREALNSIFLDLEFFAYHLVLWLLDLLAVSGTSTWPLVPAGRSGYLHRAASRTQLAGRCKHKCGWCRVCN
mmetsp:Transcript_77029/g.174198  ORF Transcript_77029/g.174198 Transcript_77029/m.174198 type:complete len:293 (+) Transcript_77029:37-915(+)